LFKLKIPTCCHVMHLLPQGTSMIKILLVDDHAIVREGYVRLVNSQPNMQVVAQANSGDEAYELLKTAEIDMVITDFSMPGISGLRLIERALTRKPAFLVAHHQFGSQNGGQGLCQQVFSPSKHH
jgi:CheY-like chemotaxis protein